VLVNLDSKYNDSTARKDDATVEFYFKGAKKISATMAPDKLEASERPL